MQFTIRQDNHWWDKISRIIFERISDIISGLRSKHICFTLTLLSALTLLPKWEGSTLHRKRYGSHSYWGDKDKQKKKEKKKNSPGSSITAKLIGQAGNTGTKTLWKTVTGQNVDYNLLFLTYRILLEDEWSRLQHSGEVHLTGPLRILQNTTERVLGKTKSRFWESRQLRSARAMGTDIQVSDLEGLEKSSSL